MHKNGSGRWLKTPDCRAYSRESRHHRWHWLAAGDPDNYIGETQPLDLFLHLLRQSIEFAH
jgi:hypothetical protein